MAHRLPDTGVLRERWCAPEARAIAEGLAELKLYSQAHALRAG